MSTLQPVESPCIGICELDLETDCCKGCFRTRDEVAQWGAASDEMRRAILARARDRRAGRQRGQA